MKRRRPALPLLDFQRIANASAGIILAESGRLLGKCVLFGLMGERLLRQRYNFPDARVCVGAFAVCIAPSKKLVFAGHDGTSQNRQNFHCWVEAAGFVFDFSSILYPVFARDAHATSCPMLMFQKPKEEGLATVEDLKAPGDFCIAENLTLRSITIDATLQVPAVVDDLDILTEWYCAPPRAMPTIGLAKGTRETVPVQLHKAVLAGAW